MDEKVRPDQAAAEMALAEILASVCSDAGGMEVLKIRRDILRASQERVYNHVLTIMSKLTNQPTELPPGDAPAEVLQAEKESPPTIN